MEKKYYLNNFVTFDEMKKYSDKVFDVIEIIAKRFPQTEGELSKDCSEDRLAEEDRESWEEDCNTDEFYIEEVGAKEAKLLGLLKPPVKAFITIAHGVITKIYA